MSNIRVAPTHPHHDRSSHSDGNRLFVVLAKWASRHATRNAVISRTLPPSVLITQTHTRQLAARTRVFQRSLPFSWLRTLLGLISLVLVFSDVPRSGTGVSSLGAINPLLQPDEMMAFGTAWNYSVFAATKADAFSGERTARVWSYKFDSTSLVWRAFGKFLSVDQFPECFYYSSQCANKTLGSDVAFKMIDSLVDAVANTREINGAAELGPVGLTIRTESEFIDRLHQYILPKIFTTMNWRTNQALYYSPEVLTGMDARSICFPANAKSVRTARFCQELWINFRRTCAPTDRKGWSVGLLYVHTMQRLRFPSLLVDLTFLESLEDLQTCRGGLGSVGYRRSDVSTIIRARNCSGKQDHSECETLYVEDYRYEAGFLLSDVVGWYRLIVALRVIGQSYFWLRGMGLVLSCYFVFGFSKVGKHEPIWSRVNHACLLFMKVPKQCVVYGSPFPVVCYALAHLLDASLMYEVFKSRYSTQAGILQVDLRSFVSYAVVQMRNVWIYALIWQILVTMTTSRWLTRSNRLHNGIIGVPAFLLSAVSSTTLFAQYRSTSFRSSKILQTLELPSNVGRGWVANNYQYSSAHRGQGSTLLGGVAIDLKFLLCLCCIVALVFVWLFRLAWLRIQRKKLQDSWWYILAPTPVPYSAGVLWPTASIGVRWMSSFYCIQGERRRIQRKTHKEVAYEHFSRSFRLLRWSRFNGVSSRSVWSSTSFAPATERKTSNVQQILNQASQPSRNVYRAIQHRLNCLHRRSDEVEATVAFMNAVVMSDPLVFLHMTLGESRSTQLAYYQSIWPPHRVVLLPEVVVGGNHNAYFAGLRLLRRVNASELTWPELVQCG